MKFRRPLSIISRTSSITNCFVQAVIPSIPPTADELRDALAVLALHEGQLACVYCGNSTTDWDHLHPLVKSKRPTGYITEIRNLVPACGPCNQSKGGSDWETWMRGTAPGSPRTRGVPDLDARIERLRKFEAWGNLRPLPLADLASDEEWRQHWENLDRVIAEMRAAQTHAESLRAVVLSRLSARSSNNR